MTLDDYHTTTAPKVRGTWNIHNTALEQNLALDFFTLLSSISGVVGKKGQANYVAANAFLDAFATYRHSLGLSANSVDLGVIEDVGYVGEQSGMLQQHFDKTQWTGINEAALHKILTYSIFQQQLSPINNASRAQLITGIAVPLPEHSSLLRDARFAPLFIGNDDGISAVGKTSSASNDASKATQALLLLLRSSGADPSAALAAAVELTGKQLARTLRLGKEEIVEPGRPLSSYGLDSLSAVELRNWMRAELGVELTLLEITNGGSLVALYERIVAKLAPVAAAG